MSELLPLFPLELVLFPGMSLPLHIFEPRYKEMIRLCLEHRQKFGVILALQEAIPRVGCSAAIVKVVRRYDDGRMDILTVGQKRFRVVKLLEELPYLQGSVDVLADEEESTLEPDSSARDAIKNQHVLFRTPTQVNARRYSGKFMRRRRDWRLTTILNVACLANA